MARIELESGITITTKEIQTEILCKRKAFLIKHRRPPRYIIISEPMRTALIRDIISFLPQDEAERAEYVYGMRLLVSPAIEATDDIQVF